MLLAPTYSTLPARTQSSSALQRLVERRVGIRLVNQVHVEPIGLQPRQARVDLLEDVAAREPAVVRAGPDRVEHLRAEQQTARGPPIPSPSASGRCNVSLRPPPYAFAVSKTLMPGVERAIHQLERLRLVLAHAEERRRRSDAAEVAAAEAEARDLRPVDPSRRYSIVGKSLDVAWTRDHRRAAVDSPRWRLHRILGLGFGLAVIVGSTLGIGILRTPGLVAGQLGEPPAAFSSSGSPAGSTRCSARSASTELGTMLPQAGGYYVYARRAFGDTVGLRGRLDRLAHLLRRARLRLHRPRRVRRRAAAVAAAVGHADRARRARRRSWRCSGRACASSSRFQEVATAMKFVGVPGAGRRGAGASPAASRAGAGRRRLPP